MKIHKNQAVSFWNDRVPQGIWNDRVPRRIWEDHLPPNLLIKFHLSSLKSKKVGKNVHCAAPCAPTVDSLVCPFVPCAPCEPPFEQPYEKPTVLTTVSSRSFWNWFGILILQIKNEFGILILQKKKILILQIKNKFGILILGFFWAILQRSLFFQRAGREGSDQNFFLPRVPKFKLDQTGWPHDLSFYTPFTQAWEITVKDRTIVTGHPVCTVKTSVSFWLEFNENRYLVWLYPKIF